MPLIFLTLACLVPTVTGMAHAKTDQWVRSAKKLSGESDYVRAEAIRHLREVPDLNRKLLKSLESADRKKFLALDVIAALKLKSMLPDLVRLSEKEPSGFYYSAINSFIDSSNRSQIIDLYADRLFDSNSSTAAQMILLDTLVRLKVALPKSKIKRLLIESPYDLRSGTLSYIRHFYLYLKKDDYLQLLSDEKFWLHSPYQIQMQALYLVRELSRQYRVTLRPPRSFCESSPMNEVQKLCLKLWMDR